MQSKSTLVKNKMQDVSAMIFKSFQSTGHFRAKSTSKLALLPGGRYIIPQPNLCIQRPTIIYTYLIKCPCTWSNHTLSHTHIHIYIYIHTYIYNMNSMCIYIYIYVYIYVCVCAYYYVFPSFHAEPLPLQPRARMLHQGLQHHGVSFPKTRQVLTWR